MDGDSILDRAVARQAPPVRAAKGIIRALLVALSVLLLATAPVHAQATDLAAAMAERTIGKADAPITILEFASFTCPHCARFHHEILPRIRAEFIDSGKARLVFIDLPNDGLALRASMLAHCALPDRFFTLASTLFDTQANWIQASDQVQALGQVAKLSGMTEPQIQACLGDTKLQDALLERRLTVARQWTLTGTPTFILNEGVARVEGVNEPALVAALRKLSANPAR